MKIPIFGFPAGRRFQPHGFDVSNRQPRFSYEYDDDYYDFHMNMMMIITIIRRWMALLWRPYHHCHCSWKLSWLSIALIIIVVIFFIVINYMSPCYVSITAHHKFFWSGVTMSMWYLTTETIPRLRFSISDTGVNFM